MAERETRVVVVGGGTTGRMTVAALSRRRPGCGSVRSIESATVGVVGVGQATSPHVHTVTEQMGIDAVELADGSRLVADATLHSVLDDVRDDRRAWLRRDRVLLAARTVMTRLTAEIAEAMPPIPSHAAYRAAQTRHLLP